MTQTRNENTWSWFFAILFAVSFLAFGALMVIWCTRPVHASQAYAKILPPMIMCGATMCDLRGSYVGDGEIDKFGTYSLEYYIRRWKRMCKTGQRYDAMREANDMGRPQPCR